MRGRPSRRAPSLVRDRHALRERSMDGAAPGDLHQPLPLLLVEIASEEHLQLDAVDLPLTGIANQTRLDAVELPSLAFGIQPNSEDSSGAERRQDRLRRRGARVLA